jgi:unsaturated rhamnogalacturonyl hydrolase
MYAKIFSKYFCCLFQGPSKWSTTLGLYQAQILKTNVIRIPCRLSLMVLLFHFTYLAQAQPMPPDAVKVVTDRILSYLETATPAGIVDAATGTPITDLKLPNANAALAKSEYRIETHEWGLTYSSMLLVFEATGDIAYKNYVTRRMEFLASAVPYFQRHATTFKVEHPPLEIVFDPKSLDDSGSLCAAMIKATRMGVAGLQPIIDNTIKYIMTAQYRMKDGTFARNRPLPNTVWADDLYQSVPALAQAGKVTGEKKYFDESVSQFEKYSKTVFNPSKGLYMHAWVQDMDPHPEFYWARVNGWAMMAYVELLNVLPDDHPKRKLIMDLFKSHVAGVVALQSGTGLWHQLLDRNDSFLETSASAMFTFCIAHAVNKGWISAEVYGPVAIQAWRAVSAKVNARGQVEGTSAGTSAAFDAAFYYNRPVGTGPHGYGSVLSAGGAMYQMLRERKFEGVPVIFKK